MVGLITCLFGEPAVGICLHASGPTLPPENVVVFEYSRVERSEGSRRFFLPTGGNTVISDYRFRTIVLYPIQLPPTDPAFDETLTLLSNHYQKYPGTRPFLQAWIQRMTPRAKG